MTAKKAVAEIPQNTALANLQEQLRSQALAQQESSETVTGNTVKASHTGFEIPDVGTAAPPISVVILGFVSRKSYYDKPYNPNEIHAPACAAIGSGIFDDLIPSADANDKQNDTCKGCPLNEFGTSTTGKGKKCTDNKVLAFMLPDAKADDPIYTASVSPSGLKEFNSFTGRLNKRYQLPAVAFISELGIKEAGASVAITVKELEVQTDEAKVQMFMNRQQEAMEMLLTPIKFSL